ncbi:hypothetical protein QFZ82_005060 [Streptomyces sp. V4I23]|uniref:DUF397 domain-containing protein n=1 Tax=Streptomyces sp. V4I23 TaxID=3042282 RepID=UPI0027812BE4|nr:DUF397 domain-containing protein [Streptomyces sp. V4I23]MDQ1010575.1 hypothetical protein [Streptomyces sp. V4I23]
MVSGDDLHWIKSSYSGGSGTECVETARMAATTVVRDSKDPHGARLAFSAPAWGGFVAAVARQRLD